MATPTSSATSPSPPMTYLQPSPVSPQSAMLPSIDPQEREQRDKAVKKFLARARLAMVTRGLRTRLSYASYKATHNVVHASLPDLEARTIQQAQTTSFSRTIAAKRKATGTGTYNNAYTQGPSGATAGGTLHRRTTSGTMAPPPVFSSSQTYNSTFHGHNATSGNNNTSPVPRSINNSGSSLYTSILAPPPSKHARTILNASDPPVAPSTRPAPSPRLRGTKAPSRAMAESTRSHGRGRHADSTRGASGTPERRKSKRSAADKGKQKQKSTKMDVDVDGDVDMKAAATLTSLLLNHRSSMTGSASSPRSSLEGSDSGSVYSYSHFAQSSTRTTSNPAPLSAHPSASSTGSPQRPRTPPPSASTPAKARQHTTPGPAPTDSEAANLMLYLATSPSPARPSGKDTRDLAAYQALAGGSSALRAKGRVLFPGFEEANSGAVPARTASGLGRGEGSFNSSISSIGTDMGTKANESSLSRTATLPLSPPLLPPPTMPATSPVPPAPLVSKEPNYSPKPLYGQGSASDFNFNDFINASPTPIRTGLSHKSSLGLRADVGRKLFEEEQMRHAQALTSQNATQPPEERGLAASIDLMQS